MPQTATGYELDTRDDLQLILDSQDLSAVMTQLDPNTFQSVDAEQVTVLLVAPDLSEVWASETSRPGSLAARYTRLV